VLWSGKINYKKLGMKRKRLDSENPLQSKKNKISRIPPPKDGQESPPSCLFLISQKVLKLGKELARCFLQYRKHSQDKPSNKAYVTNCISDKHFQLRALSEANTVVWSTLIFLWHMSHDLYSFFSKTGRHSRVKHVNQEERLCKI
jgi:hypothetical protein